MKLPKSVRTTRPAQLGKCRRYVSLGPSCALLLSWESCPFSALAFRVVSLAGRSQHSLFRWVFPGVRSVQAISPIRHTALVDRFAGRCSVSFRCVSFSFAHRHQLQIFIKKEGVSHIRRSSMSYGGYGGLWHAAASIYSPNDLLYGEDAHEKRDASWGTSYGIWWCTSP